MDALCGVVLALLPRPWAGVSKRIARPPGDAATDTSYKTRAGPLHIENYYDINHFYFKNQIFYNYLFSVNVIEIITHA